VVIPLTTSAWMMLQRNLLYTAITRAKKLVVLVGSRRALAAAIRTVGAGRRHTASPTDSAHNRGARRSHNRTVPSTSSSALAPRHRRPE
jgi:hypothetical protein